MSNQKSDKPFTLRVIIACLLAIAISYTLLAYFSHQVGGNFHNAVYIIGVIVLGAAFCYQSVVAYKAADDGGIKDNSSRLYVILLTVLIILWAGGWVAGSNEKVAPGSPQMEDVNKAKQTSYRINPDWGGQLTVSLNELGIARITPHCGGIVISGANHEGHPRFHRNSKQ